MNQLMLLVFALVVFVWFGGSMVPAVLRQNKMLLLGGVGGLVLCSFMGLRLEGFDTADECHLGCPSPPNADICNEQYCNMSEDDKYQNPGTQTMLCRRPELGADNKICP